MKPQRRKKTLLFSTELSKHISMEGSLRSSSSLLIKGRFSGTIVSDAHVEIGKGAVVESCELSAASLCVFGVFQGSVKAETFVEICDGARVRASVCAPSASVAAAARFTGRIQMPANAD